MDITNILLLVYYNAIHFLVVQKRKCYERVRKAQFRGCFCIIFVKIRPSLELS